jgi:hypothetical protein
LTIENIVYSEVNLTVMSIQIGQQAYCKALIVLISLGGYILGFFLSLPSNSKLFILKSQGYEKKIQLPTAITSDSISNFCAVE